MGNEGGLVMTLSQIQFELKAPKSQFNKFGHYAYRSNDDILKAAKPLLKKYGDNLSLTDEPVLVGDWHYIKATAKFTDKDGKETTVTGYARESVSKKGMDDSQITGTASSYARKYALNGLFLIDDTKDADTSEYHQQNQQRQTRKPSSKQQGNNLTVNANRYKTLVNKYAKIAGSSFDAVNKDVKGIMESDQSNKQLSKNDYLKKSIGLVESMLKSAKQMQQEEQAG